MPVLLKGSCHCGTVRFTVESHTPVPYQLCVCSICRKVGGVGGSINLVALSETLRITQGEEHINAYHAVLNRDTPEELIAPSERKFCSRCSSMLWAYHPNWPELLYPYAPAIDSPPLEPPEQIVVVMMDSKPNYVRLPEGPKQLYTEQAVDSVEEWHRKHGKYVP